MRRESRIVVWSALLSLGLAVACQREEPERRPATPLDLSTVGTIAGEIRFDGPVPAQKVLEVGSSAECKAQHSGPVYAGDVLIGDGKVANALVYIKDGLGDRVFAAPEVPVVIDQQGCVFLPRVAAAQVGQPIRFLNSDPLPHNVHGVAAKSGGWNFSLGLKGASRTIEVDEPERVIELKCDIHPWMRAYLGIFAHPYFAITGRDGTFTLQNVPPGQYVVEAWHERLGTRAAEVAVTAKETKSVVLTFAPTPG